MSRALLVPPDEASRCDGFGSFMNRLLLASGLEAGVQRHTAIDEQADARDVVRVVGREPHRRATDLLRLADTLVRDELQQLVIRPGCIPGLHIDWRADR